MKKITRKLFPALDWNLENPPKFKEGEEWREPQWRTGIWLMKLGIYGLPVFPTFTLGALLTAKFQLFAGLVLGSVFYVFIIYIFYRMFYDRYKYND